MIVSGKSINENSNGLWYIWSNIAVNFVLYLLITFYNIRTLSYYFNGEFELVISRKRTKFTGKSLYIHLWGVPNISFFRSAFSISIIFIFRIVRTWDKPTVAKHMQKNRIVKMIVSGKSINENSNGLWYIWSSIAVMNWENTPPNPIPTISEKGNLQFRVLLEWSNQR